MPGIVQTPKIIDELDLILADLKVMNDWAAYVKMKRLVDSLVPISCSSTDGSPLPMPENALNLYTELGDSEDRDAKLAGTARKKISMTLLTQDLERIRRKMLDKQCDGIYSQINNICADLKMRHISHDAPSRYDDFGELGDLILEARTEIKQLKRVIITEKMFGSFLTAIDCHKLIEKYVEKAYAAGRTDSNEKKAANQSQS